MEMFSSGQVIHTKKAQNFGSSDFQRNPASNKQFTWQLKGPQSWNMGAKLIPSMREATSTHNAGKVELVQNVAACLSRDHWELNSSTLGSAFQLEASENLCGLGIWPVD